MHHFEFSVVIIASPQFLWVQELDVIDKIFDICCSLCLNTLIDSIHEKNWIFDLLFNHRPELLDKKTKTATLLFALLDLLIEQFFTIFEQLDQFFVFVFELFQFLYVSSFFVEMLVDGLLLFIKF